MNAYRKEHSNGKVVYTSNGAYAVAGTRKQNRSAWLYVILFIIALVACVSLMLSVSSVDAASRMLEQRSDACHTYHSLLHGAQEIDGVFCGNGTQADHKDSKDHTAITNDSVSNDEVKITLPNENVPDKPIVEDKPNDDNKDAPALGNPGNDKEVGHAGEKCDKGMCENSDDTSGERGRSNNDFVFVFSGLSTLWKKLTRKLSWSREWWITNHLYVATWTSSYDMKPFSIKRYNKVITITLFSHVAIYVSWLTDKADNI